MPRQVGLAGVVAALSVTSDLTRGHPPGEAMRACLLSSELARRAGLESVRQGEVFYASGVSTRAGLPMFAMRHGLAATAGGDRWQRNPQRRSIEQSMRAGMRDL